MRTNTISLAFASYFVFCSVLAADALTEADLRIPPQIHENLFDSNPELIISQSDQEDFRITYNNEKILSFEQINKNASIRNLSSYLYSLYQKDLYPKIKKGDSLSDGEIMLLKYIIVGQLFTLDSFSKAFLSDAIKDHQPKTDDILDRFAEDKETAVSDFLNTLTNLSKSYLSSSDPVRIQIKKYASIFSNVSPEALKSDLLNMYNQNDERIDSFQWRSIWDNVPIVMHFTDSEYYENKHLRPYKELFPFSNFKTEANNIGNTWVSLYPNCILHYSNALKIIAKEMGDYVSITTDARTRTKIEDLRIRLNQEMTQHLYSSKLVFVDFPFCVLTKYCYIQIQGAKSSWNDDDDEMQKIAMLYAASVKGSAMLDQKFGSYHTASIYAQFIQLIKSEWSSKRFESFKKASKLPERDPLECVEENPI